MEIDEVAIIESGDHADKDYFDGLQIESKLNIADLMPGTQFKIDYPGYSKKLVLEVTDNDGREVRAIELGNSNNVFPFSRTPLDFHFRRNNIQIVKFAW